MIHVIQNKSDLDKRLAEAGDKLVVIDFCASWCSTCKTISPKLEELAEKYKDNAIVMKVDVDDNADLALDYMSGLVKSMPTFVFLKNNEVMEISVGEDSETLIKNMEIFVVKETTLPLVTEVPAPERIENEPQIQAADAQPVIQEKK